MSSGSKNSVIHKKARSGREEFDARAMSWSKAIRLSLERCSDRVLGLPVTVRTIEQNRLPLADLAALAGGDQLIMLIDAQGGQAGETPGRAACILDRALVQTAVEVQTRGTITQGALDTRPFTHTDAAICARLIDPILASVDDMMEEAPQQPSQALRLRYGDKLADGRALALALDAPDYMVFRITMDVSGETRSGDMILALPRDLLKKAEAVDTHDAPPEGAFDISKMALSAPITLDAVLHRVHLPVSRVCAFKPGDVLYVPRSALGQADLVGARGFVVGKTCLGQVNGFRAVRLGAQDEPTAAPPRGTPPLEVPGDIPYDVETDPLSDHVSNLDLDMQSPEEPEMPGLDAINADLDAEPIADLPTLDDIPDDGALADISLPDLPPLETS
jgi:flagellar motor switch protein FliM